MTNIENGKITAKELKRRLQAGDSNLYLVDIRPEDEFGPWHIQGSFNFPMDVLEKEAERIPKDYLVVTICMKGEASVKARDYLADNGYDAVSLQGGMLAWSGVYDTVKLSQNFPGLEVLQFTRVGKGCISYMLISDGKGMVIDPTVDTEVYTEQAEALNVQLETILETHVHADHISGAQQLAKVTGAKYLQPDAIPDMISLADIQIRRVRTPGHTPESQIFIVGNLAFTGDTLFVDSVGRPDLGQDPRKNGAVLFETLQSKVLTLPDETVILPGHISLDNGIEYGSPHVKKLTEIRLLLPLQLARDRFIDWVVKNANPQPPNFASIKKINLGELPFPAKEEQRTLEAGANRCGVR